MYMDKVNLNKWKSTKIQIYDINLPGYTYLSRKCVSLIIKLECTLKYRAGMLRDLANVIITQYPEVKDNNSNLYKF